MGKIKIAKVSPAPSLSTAPPPKLLFFIQGKDISDYLFFFSFIRHAIDLYQESYFGDIPSLQEVMLSSSFFACFQNYLENYNIA